MKNLIFAAICPHPPIIIPSIGKDELNKVSKTVDAMKKLADIFAEAEPETVIVISPHGPIGIDKMTINISEKLSGSFWQFGDLETKFDLENDIDLGKIIEKEAKKSSIPIDLVEIGELDHGTMVPLYYLSQNYKDFKIVPVSFSYLDLNSHFAFGEAIYQAISETNKRMVIVASGDLSHRLLPEAPAGYSPRGKEFDELLVKLIKEKNTEAIINMDSELIEEAGECGLRSFIVLLGALQNIDYKPEVLSYEGPFGVGYLVANFTFSS